MAATSVFLSFYLSFLIYYFSFDFALTWPELLQMELSSRSRGGGGQVVSENALYSYDSSSNRVKSTIFL